MRAVTAATVDASTLEEILRPRSGWVVERRVSDTRFEATGGAVADYVRTVEATANADGTRRVRQTVEFSLAIPYWAWLYALPVKRELARLAPREGTRWWSPPDAFDPRAASVLANLSVLSAVSGFLGVLLSQTLTFAADQFDADTAQQGVGLSVVRADFVIALGLIALADRRGRRTVILGSGVASCMFTLAGAAAPSLPWLIATQVGARGCGAAMAICIGIMAAEEMPRNSRAYAVSILSVSGALGAGVPILLLFVADLDPNGWRLLFALAVLGLPLIRIVARQLPESRRFGMPHAQAPIGGHGRRFWLLAVSGLLFAIFFAPAWQFTNEYLRAERGYSAGRISLFTVLTNIPGGIGIVVGGRLADVRGRRVVGAVATLGGVGATVLMFLATGWPLWGWSVVGSVLGAASVPALGVYGPELFPTSLRGRANGVISLLGRLGSVAGLVLVGVLAKSLGGLGPALAVLSIAPVMVALLIVVAYPETAHLELEDINPEDRVDSFSGVSVASP